MIASACVVVLLCGRHVRGETCYFPTQSNAPPISSEAFRFVQSRYAAVIVRALSRAGRVITQTVQAANDPRFPLIKDSFVHQGTGQVPIFPSRTRKFASGQNQATLVCLELDRPDGQTVHPSGVARVFSLIPDSGVGEAAGGVTEAVRDDKTGGNRVKGIFSNDMTCDEMTSGHKNKSSSP